MKFPTGSNFTSELRDVTYRDYSRAIDKAAWWLERTLGGKGSNFPTVSYIGPTDLRYTVLSVAAMKASYKILLPSPRNSVPHFLHVLGETDCQIFLSDEGFDASKILAQRQMRHIIVPSVDYFLDATADAPKYFFSRSFEEAKNDPTVILHSSGSTGPPKTITWTHGGFGALDMSHDLPKHGGYRPFVQILAKTNLDFNPFPPFHAAGNFMHLISNIFYGRPVLLPPAGVSVNVPLIIDALDHAHFESMSCPPSLLEEMAADPDALRKLEELDAVFFGGGPLGHESGETIRKHVNIYSVIGSTEAGWYPVYDRDPEDWDYFHFNPDLKGIEFREAGDGLFELVIARHPTTDDYHLVFHTFPGEKEYSTKDLYVKHPTKPNLWRAQGRSDDVLVLSNGEKVIPGPIQDMLKESPDVHDALAIGHTRFEVAALVELEASAQSLPQEEVLEKLSPFLKDLNENVPKFARVAKDHIIFTSPDKPFLRADKGTLIRKRIIAAYENEIEAVYKGSGGENSFKFPLLKDTNEDQTTEALLDLFSRVSDIQDRRSDQDIFVAGFDSQGVMAAIRQLRAQVKAENVAVPVEKITPTLIYSNPTASQLAKALRSLAHEPFDHASQEKGRLRAMGEALDKYSANLPQHTASQPPKQDKLVVILTGSTGSLGSYLLDALLSSPIVSHIYCLNRSRDGLNRQMKASASRALSLAFSTTEKYRVSFLHADLSQPSLGLSTSDFSTLKNSASLIIHNQWQVDFNLALPSFLPHVEGVRNLIDLAASANNNPPIVFTSTVSTTGNWLALNPDTPMAPEEPIHDFRVPMPIGYAESKHVSERLLELAAAQSGVRASVCRVGQVAGPVDKKGGVWNKQEWFPSLATSSAFLKLLPSSLGQVSTSSRAAAKHDQEPENDAGQSMVDWIPVDALADVLVELSLRDTQADPAGTLHVYNLSNPVHVPFGNLIPALLKHLPAETKLVPIKEWVDALEKTGEIKEGERLDYVKNPGVKLLDFYKGIAGDGERKEGGSGEGEGGVGMSVEKAKAGSETMQKLEGVSGEWVEGWMDGWGLKSQ